MNRAYKRALRRKLEKHNAAQPERIAKVPREQWPEKYQGDENRLSVWRSRHFLVQVFRETGATRISVSRTSLETDSDRWMAGISWDDLQQIKNYIGFTEHEAVEIYPRVKDEVNVANMRHLWVLPEPLPFSWRR